MAWNRTCISLMAFGFVIERFGLVVQISAGSDAGFYQRHISFLVGISFIALATILAIYSVQQHRKILGSLSPSEIPAGYNRHAGIITNAIVALMGLVLCVYLFLAFF